MITFPVVIDYDEKRKLYYYKYKDDVDKIWCYYYFPSFTKFYQHLDRLLTVLRFRKEKRND